MERVEIVEVSPRDGLQNEATTLSTADKMEPVDEVRLADTIGVAVPSDVETRFGILRELSPAVPMRIHLHDTRGTGVANAVATGLDLDATIEHATWVTGKLGVPVSGRLAKVGGFPK